MERFTTGIFYNRPTVNPERHVVKLKRLQEEIAKNSAIGWVGFLTALSGVAVFALGAQETHQLIGEGILLLGSVPSIIGFRRSIRSAEYGIRLINQTPEMRYLTANQTPLIFRWMVDKPKQGSLQYDYVRFSRMIVSRNWAEKVLEQRQSLYQKIGSGTVQYNPEKIDTLPAANKVAKTKLSVAASIERTKAHIDKLNQHALSVITKENAEFIIGPLLDQSSLLKDYVEKGQISQEEGRHFVRSLYGFISPFVRKAIDVGTENPGIYYLMGLIISETSEPSEQTSEELRQYFKKAIELDPDFTGALWNFWATFADCKIYSDFKTYSIEEVAEVCQRLLLKLQSNPEEAKGGAIPEGVDPIEFIQKEIERFEMLIQQRDKFKKLEGQV